MNSVASMPAHFVGGLYRDRESPGTGNGLIVGDLSPIRESKLSVNETEDNSVTNLSRHQLEQLATEMSQDVQGVTNLKFRVDDDLGKLVVSVVESDTGQVIRQIPNEEMLDLNKRMKEVTSILFDLKV